MPRQKKQREKLLKEILNNQVVPKGTEGICVRALKGSEVVVDLKVGRTYRFYDWASLTKVVFGATASMVAVEEGLFSLKDPLSKYLPWFPYGTIQVGQLLSHSGGLPWWLPIHKTLLKKSFGEKRLSLQEILRKVKRTPSKKSVYSDVDFFVLGFLLERVFEKPLFAIWQDLREAMELKTAHFNENNEPFYNRRFYGRTQKCPVRKKQICGEVDDLNTWSMGGVSVHAGLFGSMDDLSRWAVGFRNAYQGKPWIVKPETVRQFTKRVTPPSVGDWTYGFMLPSKQGSSAGEMAHKTSVGHTGFTGTSFWYDPVDDFTILILANRVYPNYTAHEEFVKLRPKIHDWLRELYV